jgi:hypothetical protein
LTTFYRRSRMRKPSALPSVIWLGRPWWLRILRAIVRPFALMHYEALLGHLDEEQERYTKDSQARGYQLGKDYVHNCTVQRKALREKIADWNR